MAAAADAELTTAVTRAAEALRASGALPPRSEDVLRFAIRDQLRASGVRDVETERSGITAGWSPLPRGLDLFVGSRPHRWAAEVKVWDVSHQIWDALKLAAGIAAGDVKVGYLIAAASPSAFATQGGKELFANVTPGVCDVRDLIAANPREWQVLLNGGRARPVVLPANIRVHTPVDEWCWFGHRVRVARIDVLEPGRTLRLADGWPDGLRPALADKAAKHRRCATTDAMGLAVPARWTDAWWSEHLHRGATPDQFEALYGLLLTRGWCDAEIRSRVNAPAGGTPPWWT